MQYLPRITPHEMQFLKDSISACTESCVIARMHFQQGPLSVFFGKALVEQHKILSFFPRENSGVYTVKCISRQAKRLACLPWKGCMLQVLYSSLVGAVVS